MTDTLVSYSAVQNSGFSDTNLVGRVLGDSRGPAPGRGDAAAAEDRGARAARHQPAPGGGAARRAAGAARADRPGDHRRPRAGSGQRPPSYADRRADHRPAYDRPSSERSPRTSSSGRRHPDAYGALVPPALRALLVLPAAAAGACAGVLGSFVHPLVLAGLPVGLAVAAALSVGVFVTSGLLLGRPGAAAAALGWLVAVLVLASRRPEGDLVVPGSVAGYVWLLGGTVLAGCCVALPYGRGDRRTAAGRLQRRRQTADDPLMAPRPHHRPPRSSADAVVADVGCPGRRRAAPARRLPLRRGDGRRRRGRAGARA